MFDIQIPNSRYLSPGEVETAHEAQGSSDATRALGCVTKQQVNVSLVVLRAVPGVFGSVIFQVLFSVMWCGV